MKPSPRFHSPQPRMVCKLEKSLYGLEQATKQWFFRLASPILAYGFQHSPLEHSLFVYGKERTFLALLIYVYDLVLTRSD